MQELTDIKDIIDRMREHVRESDRIGGHLESRLATLREDSAERRSTLSRMELERGLSGVCAAAERLARTVGESLDTTASV